MPGGALIMADYIKARPVVVTGGANGIGAALAVEAAGRGASGVAVIDVDGEAANAVVAQIAELGVTASAYECDVADADAVEAVADQIIDTYGLPGLVIANAGVMAPTSPLLDTPASDIEWVLGVNLRGVIHTLQSFGRRLVASEGGGWLLATGSEHSLGVPHLFGAPYTASKHGVLGVCDVLRGELPDHVGVSVLCPGLTTSQLWNATAVRPNQFGGAVDGDPASGAFMEASGMAAATVAERALDGVAAGDFLIATHYNARLYAERRATEAAEAFVTLGEIDTTDYDVNNLVAEMLAGLEGSAD